ncbi:hypothetical protein Bbelb_339850 [Branchiostoma belcheri]|nr:hypothetical protein Bbelb_339850 [Branchiostoma belcheri]
MLFSVFDSTSRRRWLKLPNSLYGTKEARVADYGNIDRRASQLFIIAGMCTDASVFARSPLPNSGAIFPLREDKSPGGARKGNAGSYSNNEFPTFTHVCRANRTRGAWAETHSRCSGLCHESFPQTDSDVLTDPIITSLKQLDADFPDGIIEGCVARLSRPSGGVTRKFHLTAGGGGRGE